MAAVLYAAMPDLLSAGPRWLLLAIVNIRNALDLTLSMVRHQVDRKR